jgi:hypothetical protein
MRSLHIKKSGLLSTERERNVLFMNHENQAMGIGRNFRDRDRRVARQRVVVKTGRFRTIWGGSQKWTVQHQDLTSTKIARRAILWNGYERLQTILNHKIAVLHPLTRPGQPLRNRFQRTSLQPLGCCRILNLPDERSVPSVQLQFSDLTIQLFNDYHGNVDWPQPKSPRHLRVR